MADVSENGGTVNQTHDDKKYVAYNMVLKFTGCMALKAALELGLPDVLEHTKRGKPLTAEEILAQLPTKSRTLGPDSTRTLKHTLMLLVWEGLFTQSVNDENETVYGPTDVSKWFVKDRNPNMLPIAEWMYHEDVVSVFRHVPASILDENVIPFEEQHGMSMFELAGKKPEFGALFHNLMLAQSKSETGPVLDALQCSGVLAGVDTLVDVGGSTGHFGAAIIARNPHIKGINYDLPYVIAGAPEQKGVVHKAGNMFEKVPSGDALFIKWILHDYDDEECTTLLKNCFEALPKQGKVIILEYVLADDAKDLSPKDIIAANMANVLPMFLKRARERTTAEYERLITAAGFTSPQFIRKPYCMDLIIAEKQ